MFHSVIHSFRIIEILVNLALLQYDLFFNKIQQLLNPGWTVSRENSGADRSDQYCAAEGVPREEAELVAIWPLQGLLWLKFNHFIRTEDTQ